MKTQNKSNTETNVMVEITFRTEKAHTGPFKDVTFNVVFTDPESTQNTVPGFWAGGDQWKVRYASPKAGMHHYRTQCSDTEDAGLQNIIGAVEVTPYSGDNPLYKHGPLRVSADQRHFEHSDGTPFLWLADTWWKGLSGRLTWEGFQELTADRKIKGFNVVQIVCGPYPDEDAFDPGWANEGGMPYFTRDYTVSSIQNTSTMRTVDLRIYSTPD